MSGDVPGTQLPGTLEADHQLLFLFAEIPICCASRRQGRDLRTELECFFPDHERLALLSPVQRAVVYSYLNAATSPH